MLLYSRSVQGLQEDKIEKTNVLVEDKMLQAHSKWLSSSPPSY